VIGFLANRPYFAAERHFIASRVETGIFRRKRDKNPPVMFSQFVADKRDCQRGECPFAG
jgi:hypothetical protein